MNTLRGLSFVVLFALTALPLLAGPIPPIDATPGSSFVVSFDGRGFTPASPTVPVLIPSLTANSRFSNFVFTDDFANNRTRVTFTTEINFNGSAPLTGGQVHSIGFNTTPTIQAGGNTVSGAFDTVNIHQALPGPTNVEFCFADTTDCAGNLGGTGVALGSVGTAYASLYFGGTGLRTLTFDNMYIRYMNLSGIPGVYNGLGSPVPEAAHYIVLSAGLALVGLRRRFFGRA